jgi:hypothetical protein
MTCQRITFDFYLHIVSMTADISLPEEYIYIQYVQEQWRFLNIIADPLLGYTCLVTCVRSVVFSGYSGFLHWKYWPPWYNGNIVESGIKHHNPNPHVLIGIDTGVNHIVGHPNFLFYYWKSITHLLRLH